MIDQLLPRRRDFSLPAFVLEDGIKDIQQVILRSATLYLADDTILWFLKSFKDILPSSLILIALCLVIAILRNQLTSLPCNFYGNVLPLLLLDLEGKSQIVPR